MLFPRHKHYFVDVLQIFDKLCQSFGGDVLQILLNSAVAIGDSPPERLIKQWAQFILDQSIAIVSFLVHSLVIMSQAITVSAAINSQNNALLTLLISNNFAEIKSNVFKRVAKENLHKMAYHGIIRLLHYVMRFTVSGRKFEFSVLRSYFFLYMARVFSSV